MGPISSLITMPEWLDLLIALLIGIGFGFSLEQAGFSSSRKLAGMFYGYDTTVIKVFFTAAIVALVGSQFLSFFGLLNLNQVFVNEFYVNASIVGGIIMGAGFIMGGFCPGTGLSALSIGKIDAMFSLPADSPVLFFLERLILSFKILRTASIKARLKLMKLLGISPGLFTLLLIVAAAVMFWIAEASRKEICTSGYNKRNLILQYMNTREKFSVGLLCLGLILALLPLTAQQVIYCKAPDKLLPEILDNKTYLSVDQVARFVVSEDSSVQIIDLRSARRIQIIQYSRVNKYSL